MKITKSQDGGKIVIAIEGWLDTKTAPELGAALDELGDDVETAEPEDAAWLRKGTTATLNATTSAGYSCDGKTIAYSKEKTSAIATVKGVKTDLYEDNFDGETVYLTGDDLNKSVTISGKVAFEFGEDYSGKITGSKAGDVITVLGMGATVNAGKGDDYLTSGNGGNTFLYASGDGADIIADFTAGDTFKVTKGKISSVTTDDENITIAIQNGATFDNVTLQDAAYWFDEIIYTSTELTLPSDLLEENKSLGAIELAPATTQLVNQIATAGKFDCGVKKVLNVK